MQVDRPDAVAISSAMSALSLALNWERALTLFHRLPPRKRDVVCYGAAMTAAAAGKHWELALFWLYEMKPDKHSRSFFCVFLEVVGIRCFSGVGVEVLLAATVPAAVLSKYVEISLSPFGIGGPAHQV